MPVTRHLLRDVSDIPRILDLVHSMPFTCRHIIDLPWRLSALDLTEGCDAAFWADDDGKVVAFAACQYVWATLDFFVLPGSKMQTIATNLFAWADEQFQERKWPYPYWAEFRDDDLKRQQLIEAHGFLHVEDRYVLFQHTLADLPLAPTLPDEFILRPLAGVQEAVAYTEVHRAAFESTSMNPEWRARTVRMPQYRSELDLVVVAPDGTFAGFCVGWFEPSRRVAQIEPLGVHPRFHRLGLGRILLLEILRRFKELGAINAIVETSVGSTPARQVYESVGFEQVHIIRSKRRNGN